MSGGIGPSSEPDVSNAAVKTTGKPRSFFNFRQLNMLTIAIVLSASGMVSASDLAFVAFSLIYMCFISRFAFPETSPRPDPPVFGEKKAILGLYVSVGAVIGLFLPIACMLQGVLFGGGNKEGIKAAAPHLFLLASQVFMEGISFSGEFSLPVRVFVPVFYNSRRIFTIVDWLRSAMWEVDGVNVWRALAVANMAFWCFNLFGFLLPVFLPRAFKIYYAKIRGD